MNSSANKYSLFNILLILFYVIAFTIIAWYLFDGWDYYLSDITNRPHQPEYRQLRPGGTRSHGFGIIGSIMLISLLVYSIRKRTALFGTRSKMKNWLNFHIFLGINGPLFIILHSTLKLNGIVAVSFWSMIAVALSGVLGRYLYLQIPRNIVGNEMSLGDVQKLNNEITLSLQNKFHLDIADVERIDIELGGNKKPDQSLFFLFFSMMIKHIAIKIKSFTLRKKFERRYKIPHSEIKELLRMARQKAVLEQRIQFWNRIQQLFHYWHIFHKPFAIIMYLIMIVHIGVSIWLGYTWVF